MKKLLLGSVALTIFSFSMLLFQISCQKSAQASPPPAGGLTQLGKLIFKKVVSSGTSYVSEIWISSYSGTDAAKVNITLSAGIVYSDDMNPIMSPDGQKIFFTAGAGGTTSGDLYSCNVDGTGVTKIVDKGGANNNIILGAAY